MYDYFIHHTPNTILDADKARSLGATLWAAYQARIRDEYWSDSAKSYLDTLAGDIRTVSSICAMWRFLGKKKTLNIFVVRCLGRRVGDSPHEISW
jgi:hypothetical protein